MNRLLASNLLFENDSRKKRPEQIEFALTASESALTGKNAILQGPTGIGKTRALLYAALDYILNKPGNKAIYVVRTVGQFFQVCREFEASGLNVHRETKDSIILGLGLGRKPMRDKICSSKGYKDCNYCELRTKTLKVPLFSSCNEAALNKVLDMGYCPHNYMRSYLYRCNLIITTTGNINRKEWVFSVLGENCQETFVIIDEAHSYLDSLATNPVLGVKADHKNSLRQIRQPESEIVLESVADCIRKVIPQAALYMAYRKALNELSDGEFKAWYHPLGLIYGKKSACIKSIKELNAVSELLRTSRDWRNLTNDEYFRKISSISRILEPYSNDWYKDKIRYYNLRTVLKKVNFALNNAETSKKKKANYISIIEKKIKQREECIEKSEVAFDNLETEKIDQIQAIEYANDVFFEAKECYEDALEEVNACYSNHDFDNIDELKAKKKECSRLREKARRRLSYEESQIHWNNFKITKENLKLEHNSHALLQLKKVLNNENRSYLYMQKIKKQLESKQDELASLASSIITFLKKKEAVFSERRSILSKKIDKLSDLIDKINETEQASKLYFNGETDKLSNPVALDICQKGIAVLEGIDQLRIFLYTPGRENLQKVIKAVDSIRSLKRNIPDNFFSRLVNIEQTLLQVNELFIKPDHYWINSFKEKGNQGYHIYNLDLGEKIQSFLGCFSSVVMASGTIEPVDDTARLLGWQDNAITQAFPSTFKKKNYLSFGLLGVHSGVMGVEKVRFGLRQQKLLNNIVPAIANSVMRNIAIFVGSEALLEDLYHQIRSEETWGEEFAHIILSERNKEIKDDYAFLAQEVGISPYKSLDADEDWSEILKGKTSKKVVVWMASAGKYSEGIDFPGKMLEAAILIGIPYPNQRDIEEMLNKRIDYYQKYYDDVMKEIASEMAWYVLPYRKLSQAAGRIHRRITDRGVIFFIDERLWGIKHNLRNGIDRLEVNRTVERNRKSLKILSENFRSSLYMCNLDELNRKNLSRHLEKIVEEVTEGVFFMTPQMMLEDTKRFYTES